MTQTCTPPGASACAFTGMSFYAFYAFYACMPRMTLTPSSTRLVRRYVVPLTGTLVFGVILGLSSARYYPFLSDDSLISLRYAMRLLEGRGLSWADGQPVEGYSNLLWVLGTAALGWLGIDLVAASRVLGALCMLLLAVVVGRPRDGSVTLAPGLSLALMATTGPVAVWTIGGLEQPMIAALLVVALTVAFETLDQPTARRAPWIAALAFGLLCLARPDSPLFVVMTVATLGTVQLTRRRLDLRTLLWLSLLPLVFVATQLLIRRWYYAEWVPNTALIKVAFSSRRIDEGLHYLREGWRELRPFSELSVAALLVGLVHKSSRARCAIILANVVAWLAYVACIGGDIFPAHRHAVPVVALMTLAMVEGFSVVESTFHRWGRVVIMCVGLGAAGYLGFDQPTQPSNLRAIHERWEWDGQALGMLLRDAFKDQGAVVAVTAAGCIPFWSELDAIDMLGLNDRYLAHHPPEDLGRGFLAHEHGDGAYVLGREPDLVVFHTGSRPKFRAGSDMERDPRFTQGYQPVTFATSAPKEHSGTIYVKRDSGRIGIRPVAQGLLIPGFLVESKHPAVASRSGALVGRVEAGKRAVINLGRPVPDGSILVHSLPPDAANVVVDRRRRDRLVITVTQGTLVDIEDVVIAMP